MSRIILIGCGKAKAGERMRAEDLYVGGMFKARRQYAVQSMCPWWIISAKYGLVHPDQVIDPYDLTLADLSVLDRAAWVLSVTHSIIDNLPDCIHGPHQLRSVTIEIHAGADYAEPLRSVLVAAGMSEAWPMRGMGQGEQMAAYRELRRKDSELSADTAACMVPVS